MEAGLERAGDGLDLLGRVEQEHPRLGHAPAVGAEGRIRRQRVRRRLHAVVERGADDLPRPVHAAGRHAGGGDRPQERLDLGRGDLRRRPVAERGHDESRRRARAPLVRCPRLGEVGLVGADRRGLGAADLLQPLQVPVRELTEGDAARAALALDALGLVEVLDVAADELGGGDVRTPLVEVPVGHAAAARHPAAGVVPGQPRPSDAALDLAAAVAELRLVVHLAALLDDDQRGGRNGVCREASHGGTKSVEYQQSTTHRGVPL